jgi:hypothetical protein
MDQGSAIMHLFDKIAQHGFGHFKIGDDAVLHGADGLDVARRLAEHQLGLLPHGQHPAHPPVLAHGNHRRFAQHDTFALDIQNGVCRTEIYGQIIGQPTE